MGGIASMFYAGAVEATSGAIVNGAVSSIISTFQMQEGLDVSLYSLQHEVMKIQCAINAARVRQITDQKLLEWLSLIIKAYYFGNYYCRTLKHRHSLPNLMIESEGSDSLAIRPAKKPRTITTLLFGDEELKKLHFVLQMLKSIDVRTFLALVYAQPEMPLKTYLYMDHNRLFDRDKERQQIMDFLFEQSNAGENNAGILPIVGSEGVGKASLALHCFCDPKVQNHFSLKIYIPQYISEFGYYGSGRRFCVPRNIFREILWELNSRHIFNYDDQNTLVVMLKQQLCSERFLLLLDGGPGYLDPTVWNALWDCLRCGKHGSKVMCISTIYDYDRCKKILNPAVMPVMLGGFSDDRYLLFFNEHAFGGADSEDYPELAKMGREIAKKMNGSIWGAKMLGGLLRDNLNASFWSNLLHGGFLSPLARSKDIFSVIETMFLLLPKSLTKGLEVRGLTFCSRQCPHEIKSFRELMILPPNHCTPLIKDVKNNHVHFLVTEHIFLNEYRLYTALCEPLDYKSKIILEEDSAI